MQSVGEGPGLSPKDLGLTSATDVPQQTEGSEEKTVEEINRGMIDEARRLNETLGGNLLTSIRTDDDELLLFSVPMSEDASQRYRAGLQATKGAVYVFDDPRESARNLTYAGIGGLSRSKELDQPNLARWKEAVERSQVRAQDILAEEQAAREKEAAKKEVAKAAADFLRQTAESVIVATPPAQS